MRQYLSNNQGRNYVSEIGNDPLQLPIFPVRTSSGTQYITYNNCIYSHPSEVSKDDYFILDEQIMSLELADKILLGRGRINQLTQDVFDAKYQRAITEHLENRNGQYGLRQIAEFIMHEFRMNRNALKKCKPILLGLRSQIPFLMANGKYKTGKKFLNSSDQWFAGNLILSMTIDPDYWELGKFLELTEIQSIHYDDIDIDIDDISDDDIEDLRDFGNYQEIIECLIDQGLISDEQIEKFQLEFGLGLGDVDYGYEDFPEKEVVNIQRLRNHIDEQWENHRNPYIEKSYIRWEPKIALQKESYTKSIYHSRKNPSLCFCQMCRERFNERYIERNDIEKNPVYAWKQMHLSLCLNCSKDYLNCQAKCNTIE